MKWKKLFSDLKEFLLYQVNIDLRTTNLLLDIFIESMSKTNYIRFKTEIDYLTNFTNTQTSLKAVLDKIKIQKLEKELKTSLIGEKSR